MLISFDKVEEFPVAFEAKFAIYPITVLSPVSKTIHTPWPVVQDVPKNAKFLVSKGFSEV